MITFADRLEALHTTISINGRQACGACGQNVCRTMSAVNRGATEDEIIAMHGPTQGASLAERGRLGEPTGQRCKECRDQPYPCVTALALHKEKPEDGPVLPHRTILRERVIPPPAPKSKPKVKVTKLEDGLGDDDDEAKPW